MLKKIANWIENEPLEAIRFFGSETVLAGETEIINKLKKALREKNYSFPNIAKENPEQIETIIDMVLDNELDNLAKKLIDWIKENHPQYESRALIYYLGPDDFFRTLCGVQNSSNLFYYWLNSKLPKKPASIMYLKKQIMNNRLSFLDQQNAKKLLKKDLPLLIKMEPVKNKNLSALAQIIASKFQLEFSEQDIHSIDKKQSLSEPRIIAFPKLLEHEHYSEINLQLAANTDNNLVRELGNLIVEKGLEKIEHEHFFLDTIIYLEPFDKEKYLVIFFQSRHEQLELIELSLDNTTSTRPILKVQLNEPKTAVRANISYRLLGKQANEQIIIYLGNCA